MRYLWIEDFDGGQNEEVLKQKWIEWFKLENKDIIYRHSLLDAVIYIKENSNDFDAVLLDIRFPEQINSSESNVYEKYFSYIVTKEFYDEKMKDNGCGAGIIAFMYLIFEARFPRDRIAFLSANISSPQIVNVLPKEIDTIISMIEKGEKPNSEIYDFNEEKAYGITIEDFDDTSKKDEYILYLRSLNYKEATPDNNQSIHNNSAPNMAYLAYDTAMQAFKKVGFELLHAYPKPKSNDDKTNDALAEKFIKIVESKYNVFRRNVISMVEILIGDFEQDLIAITSKKYYKANSDLYDDIYFKNVLDEIRSLPLILDESKLNAKFKQLVWSLTHCIESINAPTFFKPLSNIFSYCLNYKECTRVKYGFKKRHNSGRFTCELDSNISCQSRQDANICFNKKDCEYSKDYKTDDMLCSSETYCEYQYTLFEYASHSILKLTRNWLAHGKLPEKDFDIDFVAFILTVGLRFLFNIDKLSDETKEKYTYLEKRLLSCHSNINLLKEDKELEKKLKKDSTDLYRKSISMGITDNIGQVINDIGSKNSKQQCTKKYIYEAFVHALLPTYLKPRENKQAGDYAYGLSINKEYLNVTDDVGMIYLPYAYSKMD